MSETYPTPQSFDRALKKACAKAEGDSGERYRMMLRDRFLCRVFSTENPLLILKGGSNLLARIPDARYTRDLDFGTQERLSAEKVMEEIGVLVSRDLGDWCRFELTKMEEALDENGYSRLLKLRYATFIGEEEKDPVLIDLSLDCETTLPPERISPANRVEVPGIAVADYLTYPLPDQLADKLCAIMELQPGGWPSSRMKDLVDVVSYATSETFKLDELSFAIECECRRRGMPVPERFAAPDSWKASFAAFAKKNGVRTEFATFETASELASNFFGPSLALGGSSSKVWNPDLLEWQ